jgi:hypothetical protein
VPPDGRLLAVMTCAGSVHVVDSRPGSAVTCGATGWRVGTQRCPKSLAFSSDGARLAAEGQGTVDVIDVAQAPWSHDR